MSFTEMNYWVHLNQECPATSSSRDILFHTFSHFVWTRVLQDGSIGGTILWIRLQSRENIPRICGLPSTISHRFSKPTSCAATNASPRSPTQTLDIASVYHCFGVLVTSFTGNSKSSAKFSLVETYCITVVDVCSRKVDPVHCLEQASVLCRCTVRTSRWINKMSNNLLRYQCGLGAQCVTRCTAMW